MTLPKQASAIIICFAIVSVIPMGCGSPSQNTNPNDPKPGEPRSGEAGDGVKELKPRASLTYDEKGTSYRVSISADGKTAAVRGDAENDTVQLWDLTNMKRLHTIKSNTEMVFPVVLSRDGKTVAYTQGGWDIPLVDVASGKPGKSLRQNEFTVSHHLEFTPNGESVVSISGKELVGWDAMNEKPKFAIKADEKEVRTMSNLFDNGTKVATGHEDGTVKLWSLPNDKPLLTIPAHKQAVQKVAVAEDGKTIATRAFEEDLIIWDVVTGKQVRSIPSKELPFKVVPFRFLDNERLAYSDRQVTVIVEEARGGKKQFRLPGHSQDVYDIASSADGKVLLTCGGDKTIKVWDLKD